MAAAGSLTNPGIVRCGGTDRGAVKFWTGAEMQERFILRHVWANRMLRQHTEVVRVPDTSPEGRHNQATLPYLMSLLLIRYKQSVLNA
jgi:hypothetical protein